MRIAGDKATSPGDPLNMAYNVLFPGWPDTKQLLDRDIGAGGGSAYPTRLHSGQFLQGFCEVMPGFGGETQIVNNFRIKTD